MPPSQISVAALTQGETVPSARLRVRQLIPALALQGIDVTELRSHLGAYPHGPRWKRPLWGALSVGLNIPRTVRSRSHDVVLIQRELLSSLATLERFTGRPRVFDVDDSIHLQREGRAAKRIALQSDMIICGNRHLAAIYREWNDDVNVVPTAVDVSHYRLLKKEDGDSTKSVCWVGTSSNHDYLRSISPALKAVLTRRSDAELVVVSDQDPGLTHLLNNRVRFVPWTPLTERDELVRATVGIMPLMDSDWTRGKCSYKMLASMASGLPVVVSPVGMNIELLQQAEIGLSASTHDEWTEALLRLLDDPVLCERMGRNGRRLVERKYSIDPIASTLACHLERVAGAR